MKRLCLTVIGLYLMLLHAFSQSAPADTASFKPRKLKLDEINFVSSYYTQNGDHSAIQGGIGSEKVTDLANGIELKFIAYDPLRRKNTLTAGIGLDHHTAASQAWVSKTGASRTGGTRIYPSLQWERENEQKGTRFGLGASYSSEYNYHSIGLQTDLGLKTKHNGEFGLKLSAYFDQVKLIRPSEFNTTDTITNTSGGTTSYTTASGRTVTLSAGGTYVSDGETSIPSSPRNTYTASLSFNQIINTRLQGALLLDVVAQNGYLGLPFHRVYFKDGADSVENLPSTRFKLPVGLRLNYFLGDRVVLRSYYRFYTDDWGIRSHTASLEVPIKLTPFFSISPFYRYYTQTPSKYFAPYETHTESQTYYTSNYALAAFSSQFFGADIRLSPPDGIAHTHLATLELRYGHYTQSTDLVSDVISLNLTFK